jgi:hypothetical protein
MNRALVFALTGLVSTGVTAQQTSSGKTVPAQTVAGVVTVVGCLQVTGEADTYTLTHVAPNATVPAPSPGAAGQVSATGTNTTAMTYLVVGNGRTNLQKQVGRRVEITGTLVPVADEAEGHSAVTTEERRNPKDVQIATGLSPVVTRPGTGGSGNPLGTPPTSGAASAGGAGTNTAAGTAPQPAGSIAVGKDDTTEEAGTPSEGPQYRLLVKSLRKASGTCK